MPQFHSFWYWNYPLTGPINACVCAGSENPDKSWECNPLTHSYKFYPANYGMRLDTIEVNGSIGRILGFPIELYGIVTLTFSNRGETISSETYVYPTSGFTCQLQVYPLLKEYYRIIEVNTIFTIDFWSSSYWYHASSGEYAGLKAPRNGNENYFYNNGGEWPISGGVYSLNRSDSKPPDWLYRMQLYINPDPPPPPSPLQYIDAPFLKVNSNGLWPGLIREWIED